MCEKEICERIDKQEKRDRYVAKRCLDEMINNGWSAKMVGTVNDCPVDLVCTATSIYNKELLFNVEIKERFKSDYQLQLYPYAELLDKKLRYMRRATDYDTTRLYYVVLLNYKTCYLYDLDDIDWEEIDTFMWHIKKTQFNEDSEYIDALCYKLPYDKAKKVIDCSEYYNEYKNMS